jgi:hypothetical protein
VKISNKKKKFFLEVKPILSIFHMWKVKIHSAQNFPSEELSGKEMSGEKYGKGFIGDELSGEE